MTYKEIKPDDRLKQYVKCYYIYESDNSQTFEDTVYPSGSIEIIFNLGTGKWQTATTEGFVTNPSIELWGQILQPLPIRSIGQNTMLGIRFLPHGAAAFIREKVDLLNDQVVNFSDWTDKELENLYARLQETPEWNKRIALAETFLLRRLTNSIARLGKTDMVSDIIQELKRDEMVEKISHIATRYGMSSRYLQKLFVQYTGLSPKLYSKINRFQNSLRLIIKNDSPLTSIAYDCGYFDQSHFIREFKSFTGLTPSGFSEARSPITFAAANN